MELVDQHRDRAWKFGIGSFGLLTLELRSNPSFKEQIRAALKQRLTHFVIQARDYMAELEATVKRYENGEPTVQYRGLIVAFDGLEKLRGLSSNAHEVLMSAEYVFRKLNARDLGVHAIFTVPAALATRRHLDIEFMPVIKIREKSGADYRAGVQAMRSLIDSRMTPSEQISLSSALIGAMLICLPDWLEQPFAAEAPDLWSVVSSAALARGVESFPIKVLDDWWTECDEAFAAKVCKQNNRGTYTFAYAFEPGAVAIDNDKLLEDMRRVPQYSGWAVWLVPDRDDLVRYRSGRIECSLERPDVVRADFWRAAGSGLLYLRRGYEEDVRLEHLVNRR